MVEQNVIGIYTITNVLNGKMYVGSTTWGLRKRLTQHRCHLRRGIHHNRLLQNSWNKHGEAAFAFEVLEECAAEYCRPREQWWINETRVCDRRFGFNLARDAEYAAKGRKWTDAQKAHLSAMHKGRKVTPEERARLLAMTTGRPPPSEASRKRMSESQRKRRRSTRSFVGILRANERARKPVIGTCLTTGRTITLESITAAKAHGFTREKVRDCCSGKRKMHGGHSWRYADE